jgi:hypothetical protein
MNENSKITIKPVNRRVWSGFQRFPKCQDTIIARLGRSGYDTGLSDKEQRDLEKKMNLKEGTLGPYSDYWKNYAVRLTNKELVLDLNNPKDLIDYKLCLKSNRVAPSIEGLLVTPKADYVISDENAEAKRANKKVETKTEAIMIFSKLTHEEMRNYLKLLGLDGSSTSGEVVKNKLWQEIDVAPENFLRLAQLKDFKTRVLITDLVRNNLLRVQGGHYLHGTTDIGYDIERAAAYLDDPENQDIRINLMSQLDGVLTVK